MDINTHCLTPGANGITHEAAQAQFLASKSPMHYIEAVEFFALTEKGGAPADLADNWDFMKLPAPASAAGRHGLPRGRPGRLPRQPVLPAPRHRDRLPEVPDEPRQRQEDGHRPRLAEPGPGFRDRRQHLPAERDRRSRTSPRPSSMAIWLDTVTHIDVANAYLNGVQAHARRHEDRRPTSSPTSRPRRSRPRPRPSSILPGAAVRPPPGSDLFHEGAPMPGTTRRRPVVDAAVGRPGGPAADRLRLLPGPREPPAQPVPLERLLPKEIFVGLDNYVTLSKDPVFWSSLFNNIAYAVVSVDLPGLAAVSSSPPSSRSSSMAAWKGFFRTVYFVPGGPLADDHGPALPVHVQPADRAGERAPRRASGSTRWKHSWLGESATAIWSIIAMSQWQSIGYVMVLFIVAMQRIPRELYEAAYIDGASRVQAFRRITVPLVREMTLLATIITIAGRLPRLQRGPGHDGRRAEQREPHAGHRGCTSRPSSTTRWATPRRSRSSSSSSRSSRRSSSSS